MILDPANRYCNWKVRNTSVNLRIKEFNMRMKIYLNHGYVSVSRYNQTTDTTFKHI
jgi:hypothetical protein